MAMVKTPIEIDEEALATAAEVLGTKTKKDTVNAALRQVTAQAARRRDLQRLIDGGLPDLSEEEVMRAHGGSSAPSVPRQCPGQAAQAASSSSFKPADRGQPGGDAQRRRV
jgi:Arc/MetJ family transcription regulator